MPPLIKPSGLDINCQWYLYHDIHLFVSNADKDTTTPLPFGPPEIITPPDDIKPAFLEPPKVKKKKITSTAGKGKGKKSKE